jgi:ApaG protein
MWSLLFYARPASMIQELPELKVTVDRVVFAPHLDAPPERPYPFVYFITILNASDKTVTLKGRKWVVTDSQNQSVVVEGEGVVGKFPMLSPGDSFSYNSYPVTASDSVAQGAFLALTEDSVAVFAKIPPFALVIPKQGT